LSEDIRPGGTYKTLDEQREVLSPAEERFENYRRTIGLFLGPLALLVMLLLPLGLPYAQQSLAAVMAFVVVYWVTEAIPMLVMFVLLCIILILLNRPEVRQISGAEEFIAEERGKFGALSRGERNTLIVFAFAVFFWMLPGFLGIIFGDESTVYAVTYDRINDGVVAVVAAGLLFLLPVNWNEAVRIDWGTILLFGSGIALGTLLSETGLAETIGEGLTKGLGVSSLFAITILSTIVALLISETTSNTPARLSWSRSPLRPASTR
jgi:solute carrier family 13 (sodium-dependent dicarboxylate transporter), member 2/3/5